MSLASRARALVKYAAAPVIFRYPPVGLQPERLATYLSGLLARKGLPGDIAEIGCNVGGTASVANRMLRRQGWTGRYICYDTFGGFVDSQFQTDVGLGTSRNRRLMFDANSESLVRRVLTIHGSPEVELVKGDITTVSDQFLSESYSAVLLDVDLSDPTYEALKRFWPRVVPVGVIYVDDCPDGYDWKAREGYVRFCNEFGLPEQYEYGLGVLKRS